MRNCGNHKVKLQVCPKCGVFVLKEDTVCSNCDIQLVEADLYPQWLKEQREEIEKEMGVK